MQLSFFFILYIVVPYFLYYVKVSKDAFTRGKRVYSSVNINFQEKKSSKRSLRECVKIFKHETSQKCWTLVEMFRCRSFCSFWITILLLKTIEVCPRYVKLFCLFSHVFWIKFYSIPFRALFQNMIFMLLFIDIATHALNQSVFRREWKKMKTCERQ